MNQPKPTSEQFTHNGVLMQPHYDNAVRAWEKMNNMERNEIEKAVKENVEQLFEAFGNFCECIMESYTERNMNLISSFVKLVEMEDGIKIPEKTILKFFNA